MNTQEFYFEKLQAVSRANLRRMALTPDVPQWATASVIPAIESNDLEYARKVLAHWLFSLYQVGIDPSVTGWHNWLPTQEIPKYLDVIYDAKDSTADAYKITPRNKYRNAVYTLKKHYPFSTLIYSWRTRDRLYKHLKRLGWHWEKCSKSGYWSDVCF